MSRHETNGRDSSGHDASNGLDVARQLFAPPKAEVWI